jgi:hypothetical protein
MQVSPQVSRLFLSVWSSSSSSVLVLAVACALAGCSGSSAAGGAADGGETRRDAPPTPPPANIDAPGVVLPPPGQDASVDEDPTAPPCLRIRSCVYGCKDAGAACVGNCVSRAPAAARSLYMAAETCSLSQCPEKDEDCRCRVECIFPGECTAEVVDNCDLGRVDDDPFCFNECH